MSIQWLVVMGLGWWWCLQPVAPAGGAEPAKNPPVKTQPAKTEPKKVKTEGQTIVLPAEPAQVNANELLLKKFDLNGDGKIDEAEIAAAQTKLPTNRLPNLTPVESGGRRLTLKDLYEGGDPAARRPTTAVSSDDFLKQYDVNGDGQLDAREIELLKRDLTKGRQPALRPPAPANPPPPVTRPPPLKKTPIR